jgi:hypothetical protein
MGKKPARHRESWSKADMAQLRQLVKGNTPTRVISIKMGRTRAAVRSKAQREDLSLKPVSQSPYNRRKK